MTSNQIAYQANLEKIRADREAERQRAIQLEEEKRANLEKERATREKDRSNIWVNIFRTLLGR